MIHSNAKNGFTLIEVLLALSLASLAIIPLLMLQGSNAGHVALFAQRLERVWRMERFLFIKQFDDGEDLKREEVIKKEIDDPSMSLLFERTAIPDGSSLKDLQGLYFEKITAQWDGVEGQEQEFLTRFVFIPDKDEEK